MTGKEPSYQELSDRLTEAETVVASLSDAHANNVVDHEPALLVRLKELEEVLRDNEEKYSTLVQHIPGMVYRSRPDWTAEIVSNSQPLCGYDAEEFQSHDLCWLDIVHPDDRNRVAKEGAEPASRQGSLVQEYRIVAKDGSVRWVSDRKTSFFLDNGQFGGIDGIVCDITERKHAEQTLRKSEEMVRALVETSRDWIWAIDRDGVTTYSNPAIEPILGYNPDELVGKSCLGFMYEQDRQMVEARLPEWIGRKQGWAHLLVRWLHKDGSLRYLESNAVPILDADGEVTGFRGVDRDITERRKAANRARELQSQLAHVLRLGSLGEMAAGLAHELNQPLAGIANYAEGCAELLRTGQADNAEIAEAVGAISKLALRGGKIIRQIRSLVSHRQA